MIRFTFRAVFWVGLFVYLLPGLVGEEGNQTHVKAPTEVEVQQLVQTAASGAASLCENYEDVCNQGKEAGAALSRSALEAAIVLSQSSIASKTQ